MHVWGGFFLVNDELSTSLFPNQEKSALEIKSGVQLQFYRPGLWKKIQLHTFCGFSERSQSIALCILNIKNYSWP